jgi:nitroreductase
MDTLDALRRRASTRAFLDRPVEMETVRAILDAARWTPSGVNIQPWEVAVVSGATKQRIADAVLAARAAGTPENPDYRYYPAEWHEPYKARRRACGIALYEAQGIGRNDEAKRLESWNANYRFFDAPVGLFIFMDRRLGQGSWLDMGMFMQSIMLAATSLGLATCPQASVADFPDIVRRELGRDDRGLLICGIALGYADPAAPVNNYRTEREPVDAFARFYS